MKKLLKATLSLMIATIVSCDGGKIENPETLVALESKIVVTNRFINVEIQNFCVTSGRVRNNFFIHNESSKVQQGVLRTDSDGDGVPDYQDDVPELDISPGSKDTTGDRYSDLFIYRLGIVVEEQSLLRECPNNYSDADYDGLNSCEEKLLKTDPDRFDSDGDGIPDWIEMKLGMDPALGPVEDVLDTDFDGMSNIDEMRAGIPYDEKNNEVIDRYKMVYSSEKLITSSGDCYDYTISNIPIVDLSSGNTLTFYLIEQDALNLNRFMRKYTVVIPDSAIDNQTFRWSATEFQQFFVGESR